MKDRFSIVTEKSSLVKNLTYIIGPHGARGSMLGPIYVRRISITKKAQIYVVFIKK